MLTFDQKLEIFESFPELERKNVSLKRVNFHYEQSAHDKKTIVFHLHPNGNGYVYAGLLEGYETDDKGLVNIRDYSEQNLRNLVKESILSLSSNPNQEEEKEDDSPSQAPTFKINSTGGIWINEEGQNLTLKFEDDLWYIYSGSSLEMAFETREEAGEYLAEEGFHSASSTI